MLIQCLFDCPEDGIYLGGETYHFRPEHNRICEVRERAHQERFLGRPQSYRAVVEPEIPAPTPQPTEERVATPPAPRRRTRRFSPPHQAVLMPDEDRT